MDNSVDNSDANCKKFIFPGVVSVILTVLAFVSGANAIGIILVATAIATLGYGAGIVMNSPEKPHG